MNEITIHPMKFHEISNIFPMQDFISDEKIKNLMPSFTKDKYNELINYQLGKLNKVQKVNDFNLASKSICSACGWFCEGVAIDNHHLLHKREHGSNHASNIVCLCPNCHRIVHTFERNILPGMFYWRDERWELDDYRNAIYSELCGMMLSMVYAENKLKGIIDNLTEIIFTKILVNIWRVL